MYFKNVSLHLAYLKTNEKTKNYFRKKKDLQIVIFV